MKLIGSYTSPYVRKVRVVMAEKKIDYQMVIDDVWSASTNISEANPLGKIPCLIMEDGGAVFDSRVIVEYLDTLTPVGRLIPTPGRERAEVKCWEALADGVCDAAISVRLEALQRPDAGPSAVWINRQRAKIQHALVAMDHALGENTWCTGTHYTLADVAVGCALGYLDFRFPDITWRSQFAGLARLVDRLAERASFRDTVLH
jgi:glutathione S-transferase